MKNQKPPLIAVIGSDGSGKSTVCKYLIHHVRKYGPATRIHLGKQSGNVGRAVTRFPLLGDTLGKSIKRHKMINSTTLPGLLPSLVITCFVLRRVWRFRHMLAFRRRGMIVLTDRFPQVQIPGTCDGPVFPVNVPGNRFVSWLASLERKAFYWMTKQKPDLVIKLNVDLDVACARKPDHIDESLARKIAVTPLLTFGGASIVDIDANRPLEEVLIVAEKAVSAWMEAHGYSPVE